jgi:inner membrane protein
MGEPLAPSDRVMANLGDPLGSFLSWLGSSQLLRLLLLGLLVLAMLIPIAHVAEVIRERAGRRDEAIAEVTSKWGLAQSVTGPVLVVPYTHRWMETSGDGKKLERRELRRAHFLADALELRGRVRASERARGIFAVPVYRLALDVSGEFAPLDLSGFDVRPEDVHWDRAELALGISDVRAIQATPKLSWNGAETPFLPGAGALRLVERGIHAPIDSPPADRARRFAFALELQGSEALWFTPFARDTRVELSADWPGPSFQGAWLPAERSVTDAGFAATWRIPHLARGYPQSWTDLELASAAVDASRFGVRLVTPVDAHRMAERSIKYAGLFVLLTFAALWLFEVLAGVRVHPIQYLLVGGAICLFFLLELSLAEHLGFAAAYGAASLAVVATVTGYAWSVLGRARRAGAIGAIVAALYGYLYVLLTKEDHALVVGSLGLFATLALVMYLTRRIDWYVAIAPPARETPR